MKKKDTKTEPLRPEEKPDAGAMGTLLDLARAFGPVVGFSMPKLVSQPPSASAGATPEDNLRQAEARYQTLVEQIPAVTFMASFEKGLSEVYVSPHIETMLGYTAKEWIDNPILWYQRLHPDDRSRWNKEFARTVSMAEPFRADYRFMAKDGRTVWIHGEARVVRDAAGRPSFVQGIGYDITEQKEAEEVLRRSGGELEKIVQARTAELEDSNKTLEAEIASRRAGEETLRLSEERFRLLVDSLKDYAVMMLDEQGRVVSWNAGAERILGYTAGEIVGRHFSSFYPPEEIEAGRAPAELKSAAKLGRYIEEGWRVRKDGTRFLADITVTAIRDEAGRLRGFAKVTRDITERRQAEEQIAEQAALLDKARDAIIVRDVGGKILFWNKGAEILYGWTGREAVGRYVFDVLKTAPKVYEELNRATLGKGEWHGELQHFTKEGAPLTVESHTTLIRDNQGNPKSVLAIHTDITEKKKIETQFIRAQRMESIGTLAGGIAHDLNNILSPIMISIEILKELSTDPQATRILDTIELSALRGADIVRQVLSFARGLEGSRVEVLPRHLIKDIETIIKDTFPRKIRLEYFLPDETWTICGDPTQLHQILLNLCVNARDAIADGGTLTLAVENAVLDEQYAAMHLQARPGRYVVFVVTDSGMGMPPAILEKIFEPFFTTKQLGQGTGLGLSTVMAIVKSHDGFVNVYSEPGKGTTFKVYLPAMDVSSDHDVNLVRTVTLPRGDGETILLVDDEASILAVTSQTLEAFGYRALLAHDGAEAVAIYAQNREKIAGVLTDMAMPIMDGAATIRALMRINPAVKVIAASGLKANEGANHDPHPEVKYFLSKPYTAETLLKTLRAMLQEG